MTKKEIEMITQSFKIEVISWRGVIEGDTVLFSLREVATTIAHRLENENPRFNKEKFMSSCGF